MIFPLLQRELSIDDYVDRDEECRFSTLLADTKSENQEEKIYNRGGRSDRRACARTPRRARAPHHPEPLRPPGRARANARGDRKAHEPQPGARAPARARSQGQAPSSASDPSAGTSGFHWPDEFVPPAVAAGTPPIPPLLPAAAVPLLRGHGEANANSVPLEQRPDREDRARRRLSSGLPIELPAVLEADRSDRRVEAQSHAGGRAQIGRVEIVQRHVDVSGVEEQLAAQAGARSGNATPG